MNFNKANKIPNSQELKPKSVTSIKAGKFKIFEKHISNINKFCLTTLAKTELLYFKNAGAHVAMDFTQNE